MVGFRRALASKLLSLHLHALETGRRRKNQPLLDPSSRHGLLASRTDPSPSSPSGPSWETEGAGAAAGDCHPFVESRKRINNVVLHIRRLGGMLETGLLPPLAEMVLEGDLRVLEVRIKPPLPRPRPRFWALEQPLMAEMVNVLMASRPLLALLRFLKDPDLVAAHLRISGEYHPFMWCPIHSRPSNQRGRDEPGESGVPACKVSGPYEARRTPGVEWLDVDIDAMIEASREIPKQRQIKKVGI